MSDTDGAGYLFERNLMTFDPGWDSQGSGMVTADEFGKGRKFMVTGECFCQAITYELQGSLQKGRACHCSRCRKAFSGASSAYAELAPGSRVRWTSGREKLVEYSTGGDWSLGFCGKCGSTLCGLWEGDVHGLTLGCLNGDPGVAIEMHIFTGSKASWDHIGGDAPQYEAHAEPAAE